VNKTLCDTSWAASTSCRACVGRRPNFIGCDIHSAERIIPEWQRVEVGAQVKLAPEVALTVALVEPPCALVLRGGIPVGRMPAHYDFTGAFVLRRWAGWNNLAHGPGVLWVFAVGTLGRGARRVEVPSRRQIGFSRRFVGPWQHLASLDRSGPCAPSPLAILP
jgi:hypothetical protein